MENNFNEMYFDFENRYNKYPVPMSRAEAFGKALEEGLINEETHNEAFRYFGDLWYYVGD